MRRPIHVVGLVGVVALVFFVWGAVTFRLNVFPHGLIRAGQRAVTFSEERYPNGVIDGDFFSTYLRPVTISNCNLERLGVRNDGGYVACQFDIDHPEAAFSYGIEGRDSWGCHAAKNYGVPIFQYDPFDAHSPPCNEDQPLNQFYAIGIAGETYTDASERRFETFRDSLNSHELTGNVVVKMDIEGAEWRSLERAFEDGSYKKISQLIIEVHDLLTDDKEEAKLIGKVLKSLHENFYIVNLHTNNYTCASSKAALPAGVIEIAYVNRNLPNLQLEPGVLPQFPHELDSPNHPDLPDCQIEPEFFLERG